MNLLYKKLYITFIFQDPLYIVIDTNILLAHLKFVSELKDYPIPGRLFYSQIEISLLLRYLSLKTK